jgi:hypothetical protein
MLKSARQWFIVGFILNRRAIAIDARLTINNAHPLFINRCTPGNTRVTEVWNAIATDPGISGRCRSCSKELSAVLVCIVFNNGISLEENLFGLY